MHGMKMHWKQASEETAEVTDLWCVKWHGIKLGYDGEIMNRDKYNCIL